VRDGDMKNKKLIKRKDAVAGVIEALLLVALAAIIISTIQLVYIPQMMEQRESDHMDDVENQFSYLKSVIDLQSMVKEDVPISWPT
jgi:competence protein ComGC